MNPKYMAIPFGLIFMGTSSIWYIIGWNAREWSQIFFISYMIAGTMFLLSGAAVAFIPLFIGLTSRGSKSDLMVTGTAINTKFFGVEGGNKGSYIIKTSGTHPKTGKQLIFKSEKIASNPTGKVPSSITVYIDPKKPKKYHMDVSFLGNREKEGVRLQFK